MPLSHHTTLFCKEPSEQQPQASGRYRSAEWQATLPFFFFFPPQTVIRCSETPGAKSCRLWTHTQSCVPSSVCTGRGRQYLSTHIYFLFNRGHRGVTWSHRGVTWSLWEEILSESAVQKGKKYRCAFGISDWKLRFYIKLNKVEKENFVLTASVTLLELTS